MRANITNKQSKFHQNHNNGIINTLDYYCLVKVDKGFFETIEI